MDDRSTASVGVVLAGLAIAAAVLPWEAVAVGPVENALLALLGTTAFVAFSLRRHDLVARQSGSLVAGVASFGVVGYVGLLPTGTLGGSVVTSWWAVGLALVGGLGGIVAAYGDGRGLPASFVRAIKATAWGLTVGFLGLFAIGAWASILVTLLALASSGDIGTTTQLAVSALALGLGTGTVALIYFRWTDKTTAYLDFGLPSRRDVGYTVGGVVALLGLQIGVSLAFSELGLSTAEHSVQQSAAGGNAEILLLLIPAAFLIIGPGEELLYRNIIQKNLYDTFGDWGAVLVGSVVFALAHIPAYAAGASLVTLLNTLVVIFFLSVILGVAYLRTGNVTVSAVIHGAFDAVVFGAMYVQMTGGA